MRAVHELRVAGVCPQVDRAKRLRFLAALVPCRVHLDPGVTRGEDLFGLGRPADGWSEDPDAEEICALRSDDTNVASLGIRRCYERICARDRRPFLRVYSNMFVLSVPG